MVYLKPGEEFTPSKDYYHIFTGSNSLKDCRVKVGEQYTYISQIQYSYSDIRNITQEEAQKEKEKLEKAEKEKLEKALKEKERLEKSEKEKAEKEAEKEKVRLEKEKQEEKQKIKENETKLNETGDEIKLEKDVKEKEEQNEKQKIKDKEEYQRSQDEAKAAAKRTEEARKRAEEEAKKERQANYDAWKKDAQAKREQQEIASATASVGLFFLLGGIIYDNISDVNPYHVYKSFDKGVKFYSGTEFGFSGTAMPIIFGSEYSTMIGGEYVTQNELLPSNYYTVNLDLKYKIGVEHNNGSAHAYIASKIGTSPIFDASQISLLNYGANVTLGIKSIKLYGDYVTSSRTFNSSSYDPEEYGSGKTDYKYSRIKYGLKISTNPNKNFVRDHFSFGMMSETMTVADNTAYFHPENLRLEFGRKSEKIKGYFLEYKKDHNFNFFINVFPNYLYSGEIKSESGGLNSDFVGNNSGLYLEIGFLRVWDFWK